LARTEISHRPGLKHVNFSRCGDRVTGDISVLANCPRLTYANFSGCHGLGGNLAALATLTHLKGVNLNQCRGIRGDIAVLKNMPELEKVRLSGDFIRYMKIKGDIRVLANCPRLVVVDFSYCKLAPTNQQGVKGDIGVLANCPGLRDVAFHDTPNIKGDIAVFEHTPNLQNLDISSVCPGMRPMLKITGNIAVFEHTPMLRIMRANYVKNISGDVAAFRHTPNLEMLWAVDTKIVGDIAGFLKVNVHIKKPGCTVEVLLPNEDTVSTTDGLPEDTAGAEDSDDTEDTEYSEESEDTEDSEDSGCYNGTADEEDDEESEAAEGSLEAAQAAFVEMSGLLMTNGIAIPHDIQALLNRMEVRLERPLEQAATAALPSQPAPAPAPQEDVA